MLKIFLPIVGFLLLAALWRWTRLGEWLDFDAAISAIADDHTELGDLAIALTAVVVAKLVFFSFLMGLRGRYGKKKKAGCG